jgi:hypothetical protein
MAKTKKQKAELSEEGTWAEKQKKKKTEMKGYDDDDDDDDNDKDCVVLTTVPIIFFCVFCDVFIN